MRHQDHDEDPTGVRRMLSGMSDPVPPSPDLVSRISESLEQERREDDGVCRFDPAVEPPPRRLTRLLVLAGVCAFGAGIALTVLVDAEADPQRQAVLATDTSIADLDPATHITRVSSGTAYDHRRLGTQVGALLDPAASGSGAAVTLPIGTQDTGALERCLADLGLQGSVVVDLATLDGHDALIIVAEDPQQRYHTVVAVIPECGHAATERLAGPYRIR
ncbi:MAG: hypothetical protein Q4G43_09455 [Mobilicoccus sp.]|nr:hypothetical protein [Mobilicoccus sp.]